MASCVLLGGADFLAAHGGALAGVLATSVASVGERGLLALLPVRCIHHPQMVVVVCPHVCAEESHAHAMAAVCRGLRLFDIRKSTQPVL